MKTNRIFVLYILLHVVVSSNAAVYLVDTTLDLPDDDITDGVCDTGLSANTPTCSLRAAVMESNASVAVLDTIVLPNSMGEFSLTRVDEDDDAFKGDLDINDDVSIINGTTAGATIDGDFNDRVFHVHAGKTLSLVGINIINGLADSQTSFQGGAVLVEGGTLNAERVTFLNNLANRGGAIDSTDGVLQITDAYFHQNAASDAGFTGAPRGSAIYAESSQVEISNSTIANNIMPASNPQIVPISTDRSSIYATASDLLIQNSTVAKNHTGISFLGNHDLVINHSTIAYNSSFGLRVINAANLLMDRSLLANNDSNCLIGNVINNTSEHNGSTDSSCQLFSNSNTVNMTNPLHGSLNFWGGYAPTLMLYGGSQAIDSAGLCELLEDQRTAARPIDGNADQFAFCDMGAIEYNPNSDNDVIFRNTFE